MFGLIFSPGDWLLVAAVALVLFGSRAFRFVFGPGWQRHVTWGKRRVDVPLLLLAALGLGFILGRATAPSVTAEPGGAVASMPDTPDALSWRVVKVVDGDTLWVEYGGYRERVRLLRINTPERGQPGYRESTEALRHLVGDRPVTLEFERRDRAERDAYGRLLAYVYVGDVNVNVEMVRFGWSPFWTRYGPGRLAESFRAAERQARSAGRGLWASPGRSRE